MNAKASGFTGPPDDRRLYRVADARAFRRGGIGVVYRATLSRDRFGVAARSPVGLKLLTGVDADRFAKLSARSAILRAAPHERLARHIECFVGPPVARETPPEEDCNLFFAAHEWVEGRSLAESVEDATPQQVIAWAADVAAALDHLHALPDGGLAHRDVHARNIVIEPDGRARLIDFDTLLWGTGEDTVLTSLATAGVERRHELGALPTAQADDRSMLALTMLRALAKDASAESSFSDLSRRSYAHLEALAPNPGDVVAVLIAAVRHPADSAGELVARVGRAMAGAAPRRRKADKDLMRLDRLANGVPEPPRRTGRAILVGLLVAAVAATSVAGYRLVVDSTAQAGPDTTAPPDGSTALRAASVRVGDHGGACAVHETSAQVWCWGALPVAHPPADGSASADDVTWDPVITTRIEAPLTGDGGKATAVAVGRAHRCVLRSTGALHCWGLNGQGELGSADGAVGLDDVDRVAAGGSSTCAATRAGQLYCWGRDIGSTGHSRKPRPVRGLDDVDQIAVAGSSACALQRGEVLCWGEIVHDGQTPEATRPAPIDSLAGMKSIAMGPYAVCGLDPNDQAHCWGLRAPSEPTGPSKRTAWEPGGEARSRGVAVGDGYVCLISRDSTVSCTGDDQGGRLGRGDAGSGPVRNRAGVLTGVNTLSTRDGRTCALTAAASVWCWGAGPGSSARRPFAERIDVTVPDPTWRFSPGYFGPLHVGMSATQAVRTGLVGPADPTDHSCDRRWQTSARLTAADVSLEFRDGQPDDLDLIVFTAEKGSRFRTTEGIGLGSSLDDVTAAYGEHLPHGEFPAAGPAWLGYVVFGPGGALIFGIDEKTSRVTSITAAAGTSMTDLRTPFGGC